MPTTSDRRATERLPRTDRLPTRRRLRQRGGGSPSKVGTWTACNRPHDDDDDDDDDVADDEDVRLNIFIIFTHKANQRLLCNDE